MEIFKEYRHCPPHLFHPNALYIITGSTINKHHLMDSNEKKEFFCETLFERALQHNWQLEAWACLSNHYHFVARAPGNAATMTMLIREVHSLSARYINSFDNETGRRVWWNYWDTCIRNENSYLAMLRYVHENPVKHNLVEKAEEYPFCSYQWFLDVTNPDFKQKVIAQSLEHIVFMMIFRPYYLLFVQGYIGSADAQQQAVGLQGKTECIGLPMRTI